MRRIERAKAFKRDYRRVQTTPKHCDIEELLLFILTLLATIQKYWLINRPDVSQTVLRRLRSQPVATT